MTKLDKRDLVQLLRSNGYELVGGSKHEKWTNGTHTITVPRNTHKWSIMVAQRLAKSIIVLDKNINQE